MSVLARALTATRTGIDGAVANEGELDAAISSLMRLMARRGADWDVVGVFDDTAHVLGREAVARLIIRLCAVGLTPELCVAAANVDSAVADRVLQECERPH